MIFWGQNNLYNSTKPSVRSHVRPERILALFLPLFSFYHRQASSICILIVTFLFAQLMGWSGDGKGFFVSHLLAQKGGSCSSLHSVL